MKKREFTCGDVTIVSGETGDISGIPVVFLHGAGQTRHAWRKTAELLGEQGFHVFTLDLRGHGDSSWSPQGDYSTDAFVADLKTIISCLPQLPILVGASLGGLMSLVAVGESVEPVARALVMVDVAPRIDMDGRARIIEFMQSNKRGFANADEAAEAVSAYLPHRPKPKDSSGLLRNLRKRPDGRYYWHWDPVFFDHPNATHNDLESRYEAAARKVHIPTLLVKGEHSELVTDESLRHFQEVIPGAEFVDVSGAHHMVVGDKNDAFSQAIVEFLQRQNSVD